jgi:hypothetical protein
MTASCATTFSITAGSHWVNITGIHGKHWSLFIKFVKISYHIVSCCILCNGGVIFEHQQPQTPIIAVKKIDQTIVTRGGNGVQTI